MSGIASFIMSAIQHAKNKQTESRAFLIAGIICLLVAFDQAWQDEHRNSQILIAEKMSLSSEKEFWKAQSYAKDASIRARDEMLSQNFGVLANTQSSLANLSNRLLDTVEPAPKKIDVMNWKVPASYDDGKGGKIQFWVLVVITNKDWTPVKGDLVCDADMTIITDNVLTHGTSFRATSGVLSPRSVHVEFVFPPVSPQHPLMFFAATKEGADIHQCTFNRN
jgi:hypothetical protein